jgi:hypothetical protein
MTKIEHKDGSTVRDEKKGTGNTGGVLWPGVKLFFSALLAGCSPGAVPVPIFSWGCAGVIEKKGTGNTIGVLWPKRFLYFSGALTDRAVSRCQSPFSLGDARG